MGEDRSEVTEDNRIRKAARDLARHGLRPLPVKPGEKHPYLKWTLAKHQEKYNYLTLASEFTPERGLWTMTGRQVGYIVLDCDSDAAIQLWRERLEDAFDRTARSRGRKGVHLWFTVPLDGPPIPGWRVNDQTATADPEAAERGAYYDVQADGAGVMLPPSHHPDDLSILYRWEVLLDAALPAPDILLQSPAARESAKGGTASIPGKGSARSGTAKTGRSILSHLLLNRPAGEDSGRNNWHSRIAGHLVKVMPYLDAYESVALALNDSLDSPLDSAEVLKTWRHRWDKEREVREADIGSPESAWLSGSGTEICTVVRVPTGKEDYVLDRKPWANADIVAVGVIDSETSGRTYVVRVQRKDGLVHNDLITPGLLGSANETNKWLAKHGVSVLTPKLEEGGKAGHVGQRILRYLEWQKPDAYRAVLYLGWHADIGFVTHEGVITANGMRDHEGVMPDPWLRDIAPYHYGMAEMGTAKDILREVLTFQDQTVTAVFGAWWAACLLKGQIVDVWGHFPYLMINAASESGKTRGFFRLMLMLSGSVQFGVGTKASTRDYIGAHRNGIVHIDDPDDVDHLAELLRAAAGEATMSKKGQDNRSTIEIKMVAPILVSGESLGLGDEKAHRDRSVALDVPAPTGRMSLRDSNRPQIDDILELQRAHPDLTEYAGSLVQSALQQASQLSQLSKLRGPAGRHNEVRAILRMGARVLAGMLHEGPSDVSAGYDASWIIQTVDEWCSGQKDLGQANTLLTRILPWALTDVRWRYASSPLMAPPAYIDSKGRIWCSVPLLAAEWQKEMSRRGLRDRLSNEDAIRSQLHAIGVTGKGAMKWVTDRSKDDNQRRAAYHQIPDEYVALVLGGMPEDAVPAPAAQRAAHPAPAAPVRPEATEIPEEAIPADPADPADDYSIPPRW